LHGLAAAKPVWDVGSDALSQELELKMDAIDAGRGGTDEWIAAVLSVC